MFKPIVLIFLVLAGTLSLALLGVTARAQEEEAAPVNPLIPGVASFIAPGTGQLMVGRSERALLHSLVDIGVIAVGCSAALISPAPLLVWEITLFARLGLSAYSALDAYMSAQEFNHYQVAFRQLIGYIASED